MVHFLPNSFKRHSRRAPGALGLDRHYLQLIALVRIAIVLHGDSP